MEVFSKYGYQLHAEWDQGRGFLLVNPDCFDDTGNSGAGSVVNFWRVEEFVLERDIRSALGPVQDIDTESFIAELGQSEPT